MTELAPSDQVHYLLAVIGLTPAVLTETVYALATQEEADLPDRIIVVTTRQGQSACQRVLFEEGAWGELVHHLQVDLGLDCRGKLRFGPSGDSLRLVPTPDRSGDLEDVTTSDDSRAVGDYLLETLGTLCARETVRVTASLAGGRKTMGALLLSALSFAGRPQDRAVHVLVSEPWDRIRNFTFPGCPGWFYCPHSGRELDSSSAILSLAELPFIPLREYFQREWRKFPNDLYGLAEQIRERVSALDEDALELTLNPFNGTAYLNGQDLCLSPLEFAFLGTLALRAQRSEAPVPQYTDLLDPLRDFAKQHHKPDSFAHWTHTILEKDISPKETFRKLASNLRNRLKQIGIHQIQIERLLPVRSRISMALLPSQITILPRDF